MRLMVTVMGADSNDQRFQDAQKLLAYGFRYFERQHLYDAGEVVASATVWYGVADAIEARVQESVRITMPRGRYADLAARVEMPKEVEAPIAEGQRLGAVHVALDGKTLAEVPLVATVAVPEAGFFGRVGDGIHRFFQGLLSMASEPEAAEPDGAGLEAEAGAASD